MESRSGPGTTAADPKRAPAPAGGAASGDDVLEMSKGEDVGIVREFVSFLAENKKWWLAPIVVAVLLLTLLVVVGGSAAAPFIYTLF